MCLCVETIRIADGRWPRPEILALHGERMGRTCRELYGLPEGFDLTAALKASPLPAALCTGVVKCRVVYGRRGIAGVDYASYTRPRIGSLLAVEEEGCDYTYKYADRERLEALRGRAAKVGCDDALIVRGGRVTDTTFCNVAFRRAGSAPEIWHTPDSPLLRGTMRELLIKQGAVAPCEIPVSAIRNGTYNSIALFNAMNDFGALLLPIDRICF